MFSVDDIIDKISKHSKLPKEEVEKKIQEKQDELSGLVSKEGAAYIVARELGINLLKESKRQLKIRNLIEGLRSVDLVARIIQISEPRDFDKNGRKGSVANLLLGDETGVVRLSLWNEEIELIAKEKLKEDHVVRISNGYVKVDNRGNLELRVGRGSLEKIEEEVKLPETKDMEKFTFARRRNISSLKEGDYGEVRACLVQVYRKNPFFEVCPQCGTRVSQKDGKWLCTEHNEVKPKYHMVISGVLDDGTGNIRAVFFRELAEKLFGGDVEDLRKQAQEKTDPMAIFDDFRGLGKDFLVRGRVKKNDLTENLEVVANEIDEMDVKKEAESLIREIGL